MSFPSLKTWKDTWEEWDVRGFMILSLTLQMLLILLAPLRRRSSRSWITVPIWVAYLLADWAANFAVGQISRTQANSSRMASSSNSASTKHHNHLLAYWAPFLLVHLGGPDSITAFALEDNELWLRHLLGLVFQSVAALYVLSQSWQTDSILIPAAGLMFISGLIKYSERTRSLYLASLSRFRDSMLRDPDPGPNYAKLMDEYYSKKEARLPTRIQLISEPDRGGKSMNQVKRGRLVDVEVVLYANHFFQTFKGLIVGTIFSFRERNQSRDFFLARTAEDAFGVVEVELNFIYEALYTKVSLVCNKLGFFSRIISFSFVVASFAIFYSQPKKSFNRFDVGITYTLLFAAIGLDCIAFIMLIRSDWFLAYTKKLPEVVVELQNQPNYYLAVEEAVEPIKCERQVKSFFSRRWSESLSTYNLLYCCTHPRPEVKEKFIGYIGLKKLLDGMKYVNSEPFTEELRDHIFAEVWKKSELADNLEIAKEIYEAKGDWVLRVEGCDQLLKHIIHTDYDESLILWHLATELCYNDEISSENGCKTPPYNKFRYLSKVLSDYMMYLLVMQPTMMSAVIGIGQIRYRDTCAEAKKFLGSKNLLIGQSRNPNCFQVVLYVIRSIFKYTGLCFYGTLLILASLILSTPLAFVYAVDKCFCKGRMLEPVLKKSHSFHRTVMAFFGKGKKSADEEQVIISACKRILAVNTEVKPVTVKGDRSKSVLFDGCILAKELQEMGRSEGKNNRKWEIVSKVWVELLCCAASHCSANAHAQQLTKGGELITIVWLLMAHFGLGDQFQISEGHARAKLIVGK